MGSFMLSVKQKSIPNTHDLPTRVCQFLTDNLLCMLGFETYNQIQNKNTVNLDCQVQTQIRKFILHVEFLALDQICVGMNYACYGLTDNLLCMLGI